MSAEHSAFHWQFHLIVRNTRSYSSRAFNCLNISFTSWATRALKCTARVLQSFENTISFQERHLFVFALVWDLISQAIRPDTWIRFWFDWLIDHFVSKRSKMKNKTATKLSNSEWAYTTASVYRSQAQAGYVLHDSSHKNVDLCLSANLINIICYTSNILKVSVLCLNKYNLQVKVT